VLIYRWYFAQPYIITGSSEEEVMVTMEPEEVADPLQVVQIVILGHGGGNHAGGGLADTIILAQIVPRAKVINLYSLPRDLWVKFPFSARGGTDEEFYNKINATLAIGNSNNQYTWRPSIYQGKHGGGELAKAVVGEVVGQKIDYYLAVDFSGFTKIINLVAGAEGLKITLPYSFVDEHYPITGEEDNTCGLSEEEMAVLSATMSGDLLEKQFSCRYERLDFKAGTQYLGAEELLKFARSRHSGVGGGDFGRSQRQQVVLEAVKEQLLSSATIMKLPELLGQIFKMTQTDVDLAMVKKAIFDYGELREFELKGQVIDNQKLLKDARVQGSYVLVPRAGIDNYEEIRALVTAGIS
jgi:anionic cell wall polymer biosynthesis LytR-Cps2A-Psr (LCP) family protein